MTYLVLCKTKYQLFFSNDLKHRTIFVDYQRFSAKNIFKNIFKNFPIVKKGNHSLLILYVFNLLSSFFSRKIATQKLVLKFFEQ